MEGDTPSDLMALQIVTVPRGRKRWGLPWASGHQQEGAYRPEGGRIRCWPVLCCLKDFTTMGRGTHPYMDGGRVL